MMPLKRILGIVESREPRMDSSRQLPPIMKLPTEIILLIVGHLSSSSATIFALTCKRLFEIVGVPEGLELTDKVLLYKQLQKDLAPIYLCFTCLKLHRYSKQEGARKCPLLCPKLKNASKNSIMSNYNPGYRLSFAQVQLVMDRHFFGAEHGVALENLWKTSTHTDLQAGLTFQQTWHPRIVKGELFLMATFDFSFKIRRQNNDIGALMKACTRFICQHFYNFESVRKTFGPRFSDLQGFHIQNGVVVSKNVRGHAIGMCPYCYTDYDCRINGWEVSLIAWHQLGECRSASESKWTQFAELSTSPVANHDHVTGQVKSSFQGPRNENEYYNETPTKLEMKLYKFSAPLSAHYEHIKDIVKPNKHH